MAHPPALAATLPARPESPRTAASPKDAPGLSGKERRRFQHPAMSAEKKEPEIQRTNKYRSQHHGKPILEELPE